MPTTHPLEFSFSRWLDNARGWLETSIVKNGPRAYADTHEVALALLGDAPPCRVLDLGAGRGELCERLASRGHDVVAVERYAAQFRAMAPIVDADLNERWPFEPESFDCAMAVEILEHLESPRFFLRELFRVLRPGAVAVVSTPNITTLLSRGLFAACGQWDLFFNHPWRLRDPYSPLVEGHITPLPRWLLEHHARSAGFSIEGRRYSRAWLPGVPWRINPLPANGAFGRILVVRLRKPQG